MCGKNGITDAAHSASGNIAIVIQLRLQEEGLSVNAKQPQNCYPLKLRHLKDHW